jgi:prepilin-type N-terminal cleavage/methylation domain-containing protein
MGPLVRRRPTTSPGACARQDCEAEDGFTLLELVFAMLILTIVMVISFALVNGFSTDQVVEQSSLAGLGQSELANRIFTGYLRSAEQGTLTSICRVPVTGSQCLGSSTTYASFTFDSLVGLTTVAGASEPNWEPASVPITAALVQASQPGVDVLDVYFDYGLSTQRLIAAYDIEPPAASAPIFTYYADTGGALAPEPITVAEANPKNVLAIGLDITFIAPPGPATQGFAAESETTLHTVTYLRNLSVPSN